MHAFDPFGTIGYNVALLGIPFLILFLHMTPHGFFSRMCSLSFLLWVGKRSYGLYLWHMFVNYAVPTQAGKVGTLARTVVLFALSFAVAALSWRFIESPFLRKKDTQYGKLGERHLKTNAAPGTVTTPERSTGDGSDTGNGSTTTRTDDDADPDGDQPVSQESTVPS